MTTINFTAVQAAAEKLAGIAADCARIDRAADLLHIAHDAWCAGDPDYPCLASAESVAEWLVDDEELARAAESYVPAMRAAA
jgi:hypothetical protein